MGLTLAVCEQATLAAGVDAIEHLRARADAAVEARARSDSMLGHLLRGRGADVDRPARILMLVGDGPSICGYRRGRTPASTRGAMRRRSRCLTPVRYVPIRARTFAVLGVRRPQKAEPSASTRSPARRRRSIIPCS